MVTAVKAARGMPPRSGERRYMKAAIRGIPISRAIMALEL